MVRQVEQPPVERAFLAPLRFLGELRAHEEQLLAGVRPHEAQVGAQVGQLLPPVAGHLAQQRALAVHHLVVADRQAVVLGVGVDHRERHLVMVVTAVDRLALHVVERVVHPAHVPLQAEAETAQVHRPGDPRPRRGFLRDGDDAWHPPVDDRVHLLQEGNGVEVLPAAVLVGQPLAFLARVVEVEHRGNRVDPQPVDVKLLQPVRGVGDQKVLDLVAPEVEDVRAPVHLLAAAGISVLVERRPVEAGEGEVVLGEMRRDPVDDHADAGLVQPVDEVAQFVGRAEPRRGRVVRRDLIAPGAAEGMFGYWQELHVRVAEPADVLDQLFGEFLVRKPLPPRAQVHLVDRHGGGVRRPLAAGRHPRVVGPGVVGGVDDAGRLRRHLGASGHRVGLLPPHRVGAEDGVLVVRARTDVGDEQLPHPAGAQRAHRVAAAVPAVEVADHPHAAGTRRPHREGGTRHRPSGGVVAADVGAEDRPELLVPSLTDQVQVDVAEGRQIAVRVVGGIGGAVVGDVEPVVADGRTLDRRFPDAGVAVVQVDPLTGQQRHHLLGVGAERP